LSIPSGDVLMNSGDYIFFGVWLVLALIFGIAIGISLPQAEAHFTDQVTYITNWGTEYVVDEWVSDRHILRHILEEEQNQTALLDQINCYTAYQFVDGWYPNQIVNKFNQCGKPLNLTGVWTP